MARGRNAGNKGQGSKWISRKTRHRIYARDGWRCVWCGCGVGTTVMAGPYRLKFPHGQASDEDRADATLDHVIPRSAGGANIPANLITCCMKCNRQRGEMSAATFAYTLEPTSHSSMAKTLIRILDAVCKPLPLAP